MNLKYDIPNENNSGASSIKINEDHHVNNSSTIKCDDQMLLMIKHVGWKIS